VGAHARGSLCARSQLRSALLHKETPGRAGRCIKVVPAMAYNLRRRRADNYGVLKWL